MVYTDGRKLPDATADLDLKWNGYPVGKWEGDTFVVDSVGFDDWTSPTSSDIRTRMGCGCKSAIAGLTPPRSS